MQINTKKVQILTKQTFQSVLEIKKTMEMFYIRTKTVPFNN